MNNSNTPSLTAPAAPHKGGAVTPVTEGVCGVVGAVGTEGGCGAVILPTTFFGPVSWYAQLARATTPVFVNAEERFVKQTERSRCRIATANGVQMLSVPVEGGHVLTKDVRISDHANWRHKHWNALKTAYGESPFFDYYADDIAPFFEKRWEFLFDYNMEITQKMCELLDIRIDNLKLKIENYDYPEGQIENGLNSQLVKANHNFQFSTLNSHLPPYYQVFQKRHGFIGNLSILDLLFNEGNEAILYL